MFKHFSQIFNSGLTTRARKSYRAGRSTDRESKGMYKSDTFDFFTLIQNWKHIIGESLAAHTAPIKIINGSLIILTRHSVYAHQLSYMSEPIKEKIFSHYPSLKSHIQNIKFQTSEQHFNNPKIKQQIENKHTTAAKKHKFCPDYINKHFKANEEFQDIEDLDIRESLISLKLQLLNKNEERS